MKIIRVTESLLMPAELVELVNTEIERGHKKWGDVDKTPGLYLNAALEELGEVAHAINHSERPSKAQQEVVETIGLLVRLWDNLFD